MLRIAAFTIALALCLSCEDGDGKGGGAGDSGTTGGFDEFIALTCDQARYCCAEGGLSTMPLDDCEAASVEQSDFARALVRGTAILIEPEYGDCLAMLRASVAANECDFGALAGMCSPFFRGIVAPGGMCDDAVECASNSAGDPVICLRAGDVAESEPGVCRQPARGRIGEACVISADERSYGTTYGTPDPDPPLVFCDVVDGLYCAFPDDVCKPLLAAGAPCAPLEECELGLYCDTTCKPKKPEGSACSGTSECALPAFCKDGACVRLTYADTDICEGDLD